MRFTTRFVLLQLATVAAVLAVSTGVFVMLSIEQLKTETETSALSIARTVASAPEVRTAVAAETYQQADPAADILAEGHLQEFALAAMHNSGALFVVITDGDGIRLAHPDPTRLDREVSTSFDAAMRGEEVIAWETGTLGESARAKVPIFAPATDDPVGEVSVGFERTSVFDDLPRSLLAIAAAAGLALVIGTAAALLLRRRWEQLTLGVQPEELVAMVQNQAAVLDGVADGVIALDDDGVIRVSNNEAARMLGAKALTGRYLRETGLPEEVADALRRHESRDGVTVGDRVLYLESRAVDRGGQHLGSVVIVRDRTDLVALTERLDSVRAMTSALRVQRHEFANRMHVATGLLDAGRYGEAGDFLRIMRDRGPVDYPLVSGDLLDESFLLSFLGAKSLEAAERGVELRIGEETLVLGTLDAVEDTATMLGNLVDNAIAVAAVGEKPRFVEVTFMDEGDTLVLMVADSGSGVAPGTDVFAAESAEQDTVHGHGIGLKLSRELVRRRGGELWLIDAGGSGAGAVFGVRLPHAMVADGTIFSEEKN